MKLVIKAIFVGFLSVSVTLPAFAGFPVSVIADVTATANQVQTIAKWVQQLQQMRNQLEQMKAQYNAITGDRGMSALLSGQNRAYLPGEWNEAMGVLNGNANSPYAPLINAAKIIKNAQSVLSNADINNLTPQMRQVLEQARNASASQQALGQTAYKESSNRVAKLQQLVNAIGGAGDAKAVMDLQARIQAEQTMLQNDQSKLQSLAQLQQAQEVAKKQMNNELRAQTSGGGTFPTLDTSINR
jgi:type IV secretion system protein VirB5